MRWRPFFGFPALVNDVAARTVAAGVIVMSGLAIALHAWWLTIPLAYGFAARVAAGPRLSPLALLATRVVVPRLGVGAKQLPGPPKRFAQGIGMLFTVAALGCWLAGWSLGTEVLLAILLVPAALEACLGYCVGCKVFALLMQRGLLPRSVCEQCDDLFASSGTPRPAASTPR